MRCRIQDLQQRAVVWRFPAQVRTRTLAQFLHRQRAAAVERVHHQQAVVHRQAHQEVAGERHAVERDVQPPGHFHLHQRQRDRIAQAALEHLVNVAVARVVVLVVVAAVAEFFEQVAVDRGHLQRPRLDHRHFVAQMVGVVLRQRVVVLGIQLRILVAGDQQRGGQQRQRIVVERGQRIPARQCQSVHHGPRLAAKCDAIKSGGSRQRCRVQRDSGGGFPDAGAAQRGLGTPGPKLSSAPSCNWICAAWPALSSST